VGNKLAAGVLLCLAGHVQAASTCLALEPGSELDDETPAGAVSVGLIKLTAAAPDVVVTSLGGVVAAKGHWTTPKSAVDTLSSALKDKPQREKYRLAFMQDGKPMAQAGLQAFFLVATEQATKATACAEATTSIAGLVPTAAPARPASPELCAEFAESRAVPNHSWMLFDSKGSARYVPYPARQFDTLHIGVLVNRGEVLPQTAVANPTGCTRPSPGVRVLSGGDLPKLQAGQDQGEGGPAGIAQPKLIEAVGSPISCSSDTVTVAVTVDGKAGQGQAMTLYQRHTATLHLGALYSKLREPDYGLRTSGGGTVITDKEAQGRGPQYVAALVVQAFPRYFMKGTGFGYPGRDLLHDNDAVDRVGLVLAFGLKDPTRRFGLGLSYEIANGINLMVVREWNKQAALDGVAVGDGFTGDAATIPKHQVWAKGTSLALSFDLGYIGKIFGGGK
jgi:hypothetical protein